MKKGGRGKGGEREGEGSEEMRRVENGAKRDKGRGREGRVKAGIWEER